MKTKFEKSCFMTHRIENLEKVNDNLTKDLLKCLWNQKRYLEKKRVQEMIEKIKNTFQRLRSGEIKPEEIGELFPEKNKMWKCPRKLPARWR